MKSNALTRARLLGSTVLAGVGLLATAAPALAQDMMETVTVTGYRASLADTTNAKRASVGFSDAVFAEDIGKFPDTNIAEAFNRVPGITIVRDINGEGVNVQVRGLGSSFTKVLLNGSQVAMGSTGATDSQGTNREVDLNMLPTELFTQLTVDKSPRADLLEGGAAGTVNMRSMRPFDKPGMHLTYSFGGAQSSADHTGFSPRGTIVASDTEGPFGILIGLTGNRSNQYTKGFETIGWTTPKLNAAMCPANDCATIGGGNWTIPDKVPDNVTAGGLTPGATIDKAMLTALNPGLTVEQIGTALIPRLGRPSFELGSRSRYNGIVSLEYRPTDEMHFYLDFVGGRLDNNINRSDIDWVGRNGSMIPENLKINSNGVVTSGTFANSQFFLEARPYKEKEDFLSINPGMDWQVTDKLHVMLQANATRSHFFRDSPTILVNTPMSNHTSPLTAGDPVAPTGGATLKYTNTGGIPVMDFNVDLNNPANFTWQGGRVNLQEEKRYTYTNGVHGDVEYGGDVITVKGGFAYDEAFRNIMGYDNSQNWQNAVCGDSPNVAPAGNSNPPCQGLNTATPGAGYPTYPGLGTYYTSPANGWTGPTTVSYSGSLIPQSSLASYLMPGPSGFITVNYDKFKKDSHYSQFAYPNAPTATGSNTGASAGLVDEKNWAYYMEVTGKLDIGGRALKYNAGMRWVETHQTIGGYVSHADVRNNGTDGVSGTADDPQDGGKYPSYTTWTLTKHTYQSFLPSLSLVYEVADDFQVRASVSRSMTRPNPSAMLPGVSFGDPSAAQVTIGNPALAPYYSNNIDIGAELYTGGEGYIGFTAFRKGLSGFTVLGNSTAPFSYLAQYGITYSTVNDTQRAALQSRGCTSDTNCNTNIIVQKQVNAQGLLTVNGLEMDMVQPLDFLTDPYLGLKGFGFTANFTIVDQKGSGAAPAIATGVAPYTYNLTGYYEQNGIMLRMSYNFTAQSYSSGSNQNSICLPNSAATGCPGGAYLFGAARGQADFSSSLKLATLFGELPSDPELTFNIQNVFNSKLKSYFQYPSAPFTYYQPGSLYMMAVRGSF
jgi:TonB-dependent receptor